MSNIDFSKLTVNKLKDQLRALKLPLGGNKPDLVLRLQQAYGQVAAAPATAAPPMPPAQVPLAPVGYPPALTAPVVAQMAGLPVVAPAAPAKTKAPAKSPIDVLKSGVRNADQTLGVAVAALLEVYVATDRYHGVIAALAGVTENKPPTQVVPQTAEGLKTFKVEDLKKILKDRGEKVGGKKEDLILRILYPTPKQAEQVLPPPPPMLLPPAGTMGDDAADADTEPMDALPGVPQVPGLITTLPGALPMQVALPLVGASSPRLPVPGLPVMGVPGLPVMGVPGLPVMGAMSPRTAGLPMVPAALPTGLPFGLPIGLPTVSGGLPVAGSPKF